MAIERAPKNRGITDVGKIVDDQTTYVAPVKTIPTSTAKTITSDNSSDITSVIDSGVGYITFKRQNGNKYKRSNGTISWRQNNPGNIKHGQFASDNGSIGPGSGGHATFPSLKIGRKAQETLLFSDVRGYNKLSIAKAIAKYAPADDKGYGVPKEGNQPNQYAKFICKYAKVDPSAILSELTADQRQLMLEAMQQYEGFKVGTEKQL